MNAPESYVDRLTEAVARAEKNAMANELAPYHDERCACRLCLTKRWLTSPEAKEAADNWRAR